MTYDRKCKKLNVSNIWYEPNIELTKDIKKT